MEFETERLVLRPWKATDAEDCFRYAKDSRVGPAAGWPPHTSVEESRRIIKTILSIPETYAIVWKESGLPVGSIGLMSGKSSHLAKRENECELGFWLGVPYWGRGVMPEAIRAMLLHAFGDLGANRIWCGHYDGNIQSRRVQEKCGFRHRRTEEAVPVPQLHETRRGHVFCLEREDWQTAETAMPQIFLRYGSLREIPKIKVDDAAAWFHTKWGVPESAYLECMDAYLAGRTEFGWYLCLDGDRIVGGLGVIENDFHERKDLTPNVCAVYVEESHRRRGIAGRLLDMAVEDLRSKGISPVYLLTDHTGFYERYGWEFLCTAMGDDASEPSRMYVHR